LNIENGQQRKEQLRDLDELILLNTQRTLSGRAPVRQRDSITGGAQTDDDATAKIRIHLSRSDGIRVRARSLYF